MYLEYSSPSQDIVAMKPEWTVLSQHSWPVAVGLSMYSATRAGRAV